MPDPLAIQHRAPAEDGGADPACFGFTRLPVLADSFELLYETSVTPEKALATVDAHVDSLIEVARLLDACASARVLGIPALLHDRAFAESFDLERFRFDPEAARRRWEQAKACDQRHDRGFDTGSLEILPWAPGGTLPA